MNSSPLRTSLGVAVATLLSLAACNKERSPATGAHLAPGVGELPNDAVVASYNGGKVTGEQVNSQAAEKVYQARKEVADQLAMDAVLAQEAKKQGLADKQEYVKKEVESKVTPPSEDQIKQYFEQLKARGRIPPGMELDSIKGQIADAMKQQQEQEVAQALFERLRKEYNVQVNVPQPRVSVEPKGPSRGPDNAPVTIVEFSDFQCPFCGRAYETVEQVMQNYAGKVRLVFRNFPLSFHPNAQKAAEASMCAEDQGKFWPFYSELFKNQQKLSVADLKEDAKGMGLDSAKFDKCLDSNEKAKAVQVDQEAGQKAGVNGTPAFFINGVMLSGAQPYDEFKKIIDQELAQK